MTFLRHLKVPGYIRDVLRHLKVPGYIRAGLHTSGWQTSDRAIGGCSQAESLPWDGRSQAAAGPSPFEPGDRL